MPTPQPAPEKHATLADTEPFGCLPPTLLGTAARRSEWVRLGRRSAIPLASVAMLRVVGGRVSVVRRGEQREVLLGLYAPGELVGLAAVLGRRDPSWLHVGDDLVALRVPAEVVRDLAQRHAPFATALGALLATRLLHAEERLLWHSERSVAARLAGLLCTLAERYGERSEDGALTVPWRPTHREIAAWVGCTRETATAVLSRLRREGLADLSAGRLFVPDPDALRRWS